MTIEERLAELERRMAALELATRPVLPLVTIIPIPPASSPGNEWWRVTDTGHFDYSGVRW